MAKDPAFLFYPGDYTGGTMHLDFQCKGAYMDLLMVQFQRDHMTLHMIKHVLGHMFEHIWPQINDKFEEKDGKFWNVRLREEKQKRQEYCKSRASNRKSDKKRDPDMFSHMSSHMENENKNENNIVKLSKNGKQFVNFKAQGEVLLAQRIERLRKAEDDPTGGADSKIST